MTPTMRLGVQAVQQNVGWAEMVALWRYLDRETRFHSLWTMDHLIPPADEIDPQTPCFESTTTLAAAAQITGRLRLGCLVTCNTFRHPSLLAKIAATLDHASQGRLELSLGAGWHEGEHRAFGIPLPPMRERQDRFEEAAALLRAVLEAEKPVSFHGRYYALHEAPFQPRFVQQPHPPLVIGGGGEKRTLRTAALYADVANLLGPVSVVRHKLEVLERHCRAVGRDFDAIRKTVHVPVFAHSDPKVLGVVAPGIAHHLELPLEQVLAETPVGPPQRVCEVIERYAQLGVTEIVFPAPGPWDLDAFRRLDEEVLAVFD
jgi:F420-dependent oxidoreductase-like protein